jgi:DNA topoisomerase IB
MMETKKGKESTKLTYSESYEAEMAEAKFYRVRKLMVEDDAIKKQYMTDMEKGGEKKEAAQCLWLMDRQATRPGSDQDTQGIAHLWKREPMKLEQVIVTPGKVSKSGKVGASKVEIEVDGTRIHIRDKGTVDELMRRVKSGKGLEDTSYWLKSHGATNLEGRHVIQEKDGVHLKFVGKEGVWHDHLIEDKKLAAMLVERASTSGKRGGKLFDLDETQLREYTRSLDAGKFSPKDFRTKRANEIAIEKINSYGRGRVAKTEQERQDRIKEVAQAPAQVLGNRFQQCIDSYIDPSIWAAFPPVK